MQSKKTIKKSPLAPTILIAGGAGFIGSHLAEVLLQKEARVIILDNFSTGKDVHINHLLKNPKFALYDVDINQGLPPEIESVDYIFHLAGLEEYLYSKDDLDLDSLLTNAVGTKNLLDLAKSSEAKFLLVSTIDVYGGMISQLNLDAYFGKSKMQERRYSLAEAKRYAEALVWEYYKRNSTNVRIVRLPEVYGPRMNLFSSGYLGKFLSDLTQNKGLKVKGDGSVKEYYLYIDDAVAGMIKGLLNDNTEGKIYTLVHKEPTSALETAFLVKSLADRQIEVKFEGEEPLLSPASFVPDTSNLGDLKWQPRTTFKQGVIKTLTWLGYEVNEQSFKQAKLIEKKRDKTQEQLTTLYDVQVKELPVEKIAEATEVQQNYDSRQIADTKDLPKIKIKNRFKLNLGISFPRISLASKISLFFVIFLSFLLVFIFMPLFNTYSSSKKAMDTLVGIPELIARFDLQQASDNAELAQEGFLKANRYFSSLDWLFKVFGKEENHEATSKLLSSVASFSNVAYDVSSSAAPLKIIWDSLKPESENSFDPAALDETKLHISNAKNNLQRALADFNEVNKDRLPEIARKDIGIYEEVLSATQEGLDLAWAVSSDLPDLLGFDGPKKYLILFQNNNEIRPTGGFIGSYAFLYLNQGKIEEITIDDIYNPDGQIDVRNIRVTPPKPIGDMLVEDRLYIRNANWDPDFTRSADAIKNLFFMLSGENIDGVVAADLHLVQNLLGVTGPLFLTSYNEEVTAQNLYERTQFHASYDYQEGSDQKRQFLTVLGSKLIETLFTLDSGETPQFVGVLGNALNQRHLQIYLFASPLNASLLEREWAGSLVRTDGDYLQVVNANLGGTKANYYVENAMEYKITSKTRDGLLRAELTLDYVHTGVDESWPGGPYTNYVRVLAQKGAKLTGGKVIYDLTIEDDIFDEIIISEVEPYISFETSFVLKPSSNVKLIFYYDLPVELSVTKDQGNYSLAWQKQAGTNNDDFDYSFSLPFGMQMVKGSNNFNYQDGIITIGGKLNQDLILFVELE